MNGRMNKFVKGPRAFAVLPLVFLFLLTAAEGASALRLEIRNDFSKSLNTAVVYHDNSTDAWTTKGWYVTKAGESRTVNFSSSKETIYVHSFLAGDAENNWGKGDVTRVVVDEAFMYADGQKCPSSRGSRTVKFTKFSAKRGVVDYRPVRIGGEPLPTAGQGSSQIPQTPQTDLLKLINAERTKAGLKPLGTNAKMIEAALTRAKEMTVKADISVRPDGRRFETVLQDYGLTFAQAASSGSRSEGADPRKIFQNFYEDPGARKTMLTPEFTQVGVGIVKQGGGYYSLLLYGGDGPKEKSLSESWKDLEDAFRELKDLF